MKRLRIYKTLTHNITGVKKSLAVLGLLKVWNLVCNLIPLSLYSFLVDRVLVEKDLNKLPPVIMGYLGVYLLATVGIAVSRVISCRITLKYDLEIKDSLLKKYMNLNKGAYDKYSSGDVRKRIEEGAVIAEKFFITHVLDFAYAVISSFALAVILLWYDWRIAVISFVFVPVAFWVVNFLGNRSMKSGKELWELQTKYESFLHSAFQNWKDVKINNLEDAYLDELNVHLKKIRRVYFLNQFYQHIGVNFSFFTNNFITQLFIYFIGGIFVIKGYTQIGTLLVFINFYGQFFGYIQNIGDSIISFKTDLVSIEKVIEVLHLENMDNPYKKIAGADIEIKNLNYAYEGNDSFALTGVSFSVCKGEHLAIVGESGSGKSTIAKLLTGQILPQDGTISIGGVEVDTVDLESIAEKVSIVSQEPILFNMTIRENLLLAKANATDSELIECCRKASIYNMIETLPGQFDTIIGEKGVKFSGGQKQRLSIARTFLADKDIIIFDESTSALDSERETDIIKEIKSLSTGKTMISIAHRLSTILNCDKVMVLKSGEVVGMDTHKNLQNQNEFYDMLFLNQYIGN